MYKHILIPTDGSPLSDLALQHGIKLAKAVGARISIVTVIVSPSIYAYSQGYAPVPPSFDKELEAWASETLARADRVVTGAGVECTTIKLRDAQPYHAIISAAENEKCDLILMASHGRRGLSAIVLGSETLKVLTHSKIPVLVYRGAE